MILFVALVALAFPQGTHAGCLTDQAVEGFFEGLVRLVDAIPRSRFHSTVAVSLRRERARGDPLEASAPAQSSCATARAISPPTRARDDSGRRARVSRHVFPTEDPPRFRFGTEPSVGRDENLPPGPPPSLLRSRHMAFPDDPSAASLVSFLPSLRRLESPPAGSPSRTAAA